ncbi:MAG: hypothetical protein D6815_10205 [Candidatus Dadabacteria bacterium]|nr:MAG: hypothetical protein D6815_10205 [Candidatus Dadabacteria bacterium]
MAAAHVDRIERRARELALPDPVLDPSWPEVRPLEREPASAQEQTAAPEERDHELENGAAGPVQEDAVPDPLDEPLDPVERPSAADGFEPDPQEW